MRSFFALLRLSALQLRYYKTRYLIMGLLLVLGSGFLFISLAYLHSIEKSLEQGLITRLSGHLQVYPPQVKEISLYQDPTGQNPWIQDPRPLEKGLQSLPGLLGSTRRILTGGLLQKGEKSMGVLIAGLEMEKEEALRHRVSPRLATGLVPLADQEILVGRGVAKVLKIIPGDRIPLLVPNESGFISGRRFLVKGFFTTPGLDPIAELFVYLNLSALQPLIGLEKEIGHLVLFTSEGTGLDLFKEQLARNFKSLGLTASLFTWEEVGRPFLGILSLSRIVLGLTNLLIIIIISLSINNSTLMSLFDRTPELGTLLILGTRPRVLLRLLWGELILFGLVTLSLGLLLGWVLTVLLGRVGIPALNPAMAMAFGQERLYFSTDGRTWVLAFSVSLITLFLASLWPILRTCRMNLAQVLKER